MSLYYKQSNNYEKKYLKYKKKYMELKQKGGNVDLLCTIMPRYAEIITSLNISYPKVFHNYISPDYKDIIFIDGDKFISNIGYQLFNILNYNYETFKDFYISSLYKNKLSNFEKIRIIKTFFQNNKIFDELNLPLKASIIITFTHYDKKSEHYNFYVENVNGENYNLIVVCLPEILDLHNLSQIFFVNQLLYLNVQLKSVTNKDEYSLCSFEKIDGFFEHQKININTFNISFEISLIDDIESHKYKFTKYIKKAVSINNGINLKYNNKEVRYVDNNLLHLFIIDLIKNDSPVFNPEKYIKTNHITGLGIELIDEEYILQGNIYSNYNNNYLNNYITNKKLHVYDDYDSVPWVSNENNRFFFRYNSVKRIFLEKYDNMKKFSAIISEPIKMNNKATNSSIYKNFIKEGDNIFSFIYKLKKKTSLALVDNIFYDYCSSLCANEFKIYFPNFAHTFYYFVHDDLDNQNYYNGIIKIIDEKLSDEQLKQNLYLNCRYTETLFSEDDCSGIAIEEITDNRDITFLIEKGLRENTILESKLKTSDMFDYILWGYFIQIYTALNTLKNNFTHYDLHFDNIIYKPVPNNLYVKINYYNKSSIDSTNSIQFTVYTKYIPVIIDYGRANFTCGEMYTKKIADILCDDSELNKCGTSNKESCDLTSHGIHYSETSEELDNVKNSNISQDLRYFALVMELIIDKMTEKSISKTNLYIYKRLKQYKLSGWLNKETKYLFFNKVRANTKQFYVSEQTTKKGEINNVESFYKYLIDFYDTRIKKIFPKFEEHFKANLYGTMYIDITKTDPWKFIIA